MSQPNTNLIFPITPSADHTGKEGYFVDLTDGEAVISTTATVAPFGVIIEGGTTAGKSSIALPGVSGSVPVKITGTSPGTIAKGTKLILAAEDGTVKADPGTGARVIVAEAQESGVANEIIEARLLEPKPLGGDITDGTTNGAAAAAADLAALKAETELIGDALRATLAALETAGVITLA
jgi:hypothetical protein